MIERRNDYYFRKAKLENFRSRAAYKLIQTVQRYPFIKPGDVVVDFGAAPGGWIQAAIKIVGTKGFVLGVDVKSFKPFDENNIKTIIADIRQQDIPQLIMEYLPRKADVVISDVSPRISGIWEVDHARQINLASISLRLASKILKNSGNFFVKVFQGGMFNNFLDQMKPSFGTVRLVKPAASKRKSAEIYVLGIGLRQSIE